MGSCFSKCIAWKDRRKHLLRTRYTLGDDSPIEFENLVEEEPPSPDDPSSKLLCTGLTDDEKRNLRDKNYDALIERQKTLDEEIADELARHEEELREAEELEWKTRRDAAHAANTRRHWDMATSDDTDWRLDDDAWNTPGGAAEGGDEEMDDDDFGEFLASVTAENVAARLKDKTRSKGRSTPPVPTRQPAGGQEPGQGSGGEGSSGDPGSSRRGQRSRGEAEGSPASGRHNPSLDLAWEHEDGIDTNSPARLRAHIRKGQEKAETGTKSSTPSSPPPSSPPGDLEWDFSGGDNNPLLISSGDTGYESPDGATAGTR